MMKLDGETLEVELMIAMRQQENVILLYSLPYRLLLYIPFDYP